VEPLDAIAAQRVLPVLRTADVGDAVETARACARAGMRVVELTRTTPDVESAVRELVADGLIVGVGTIREEAEVYAAAAAGASFAVSFCMPPGMVDAARAAGLVSIPGAFTPHEIATCTRAGADAVKLFPAGLATPGYLRDLAPLVPDARILVTGGIQPDGAAEWLNAGALAVGLGSALGTAVRVGAHEVERRCRAALAAAHGTAL
jgi:2-dehydro-3-deoxyphosphogluconate aldolase/(4S)-4-hydroxy-2-oxoglutarate aldolase